MDNVSVRQIKVIESVFDFNLDNSCPKKNRFSSLYFWRSFIEKNISVRDDCSFKTYFVNKTDFYNQLENRCVYEPGYG